MNTRIQLLRRALEGRILVLDGAMGTMIQRRTLQAADFGGPAHEGCNEHLVLTRPDVIADIHRAYLAAGADIIETNTFGGTPMVLREYGLAEKAAEINQAAAALAREQAQAFETPDRPRFVAGSMGPTTRSLSVTGGATFAQLAESFEEQAVALVRGGADFLLLETCQDTLNIKAALAGVRRASLQLGGEIPTALSVTIETGGTMLAGQTVEALAVSVRGAPLLYLGLNCASGPSQMAPYLAALASCWHGPVACVPNAGMPDADGHYRETPEAFAAALSRLSAAGLLNVAGGCCGTTPEHIGALARALKNAPVRRGKPVARCELSGLEPLDVGAAEKPVVVGERANVIGSRAFKTLITEDRFDDAAEIARRQVKSGARVVDVCLANPDRDEASDMDRFLLRLMPKIKAPVMIDSTDARVVEAALQRIQGKALINSVNLENGLERFDRIVPLARDYGAALVVGCIDEDPVQSMALSRERKIAIALRSFALLTGRYGMAPEDLYFDPLVFPLGTGEAAYARSAVETIEGVRLIRAQLPQSRTVLGISNVSFGLPPAGREVLNSVFLHHCVQAGLDLALVNPEKWTPAPRLPADQVRAAENLLFVRGPDPLGAFVALFRSAPATAAPARGPEDRRTVDERLIDGILEGSAHTLERDLDEAMKTRPPLAIVNGPLMQGMAAVGVRFNNNQMIVAEVLQSAEVMRRAIRHLEPHMDRAAGSVKGRVLLATVRGDVHDIGKNLVQIILSNNGYEVVDLGIKCGPEQIIEACRARTPDLVGLSGLLVKSAHQMVDTARALREAGVRVPLIIGGAALSEQFVREKIAPAYEGPVHFARDAMFGLATANRLAAGQDSGPAPAPEEPAAAPAAAAAAPAVEVPAIVHRAADVPANGPLGLLALPETTGEALIRDLDLELLKTRYLGMRGADRSGLEARVKSLLALMGAENWIQPRGVCGVFEADQEPGLLHLYEPGTGRPAEDLVFPLITDAFSLSDFALPRSLGVRDRVALLAVTTGAGVEERVAQANAQGRYLDGHLLQAVALECAQAFVRRLHAWLLREVWRLPAERPGLCAPFGFSSSPGLDEHEKVFRLLDVPGRTAMRLTESNLITPQASMTAVVFHHPQAHRFDTGCC